MKIRVCTIINNYLKRSYASSLNETQFSYYSRLIDDSQNSGDLKIEALQSIVLSVEKNQDLPGFVIETLIKNISKDNDKLNNFVALAISIVSEQKEIKNVDSLSAKLLEDWVIVRDGIDVSFEKSPQDNHDCQSISAIVAQIFVNSLQKNTRINNESIENLVKALNRNDKQTCILSAKALYLASKTHKIQ
ncbi:unnamed protein product, partial [Rotaria magnacalcarata]